MRNGLKPKKPNHFSLFLNDVCNPKKLPTVPESIDSALFSDVRVIMIIPGMSTQQTVM